MSEHIINRMEVLCFHINLILGKRVFSVMYLGDS